MTPHISSAQPFKLFHYSDAALRLDHELVSESGQLGYILRNFEARCTEYPVHVSYLADQMRDHARRAEGVDQWVRTVGRGFEAADRGGLLAGAGSIGGAAGAVIGGALAGWVAELADKARSLWDRTISWLDEHVFGPVAHSIALGIRTFNDFSWRTIEEQREFAQQRLADILDGKYTPVDYLKEQFSMVGIGKRFMLMPIVGLPAANMLVTSPFFKMPGSDWLYSVVGETIFAMIPIFGDGKDILAENLKVARGEKPDTLVLSLSWLGLAADSGWLDIAVPDPVDGANVGLGALKGIAKAIPAGPARDALAAAVKNPDELEVLLETSEALAKHPEALKFLLEAETPEAIVLILKQGPETIETLSKLDVTLLKSWTDLANVNGAPTLLEKLAHKSPTVVKGAEYELEYALAHKESLVEIGRKLEVVNGGTREIDHVLEGNIFVNVKSYDWTRYNDFTLQMEIEKMLKQAEGYREFAPSTIKYVFNSSNGTLPEKIRKALEGAGIVVEVWP
jgi:hypothetical protein